MDIYEIFDAILDKLVDGRTITFTPDNIAEDDNFLLFGSWRPSVAVSFRDREGEWVCYFNGQDAMRLSETPKSFWRSIYKNL